MLIKIEDMDRKLRTLEDQGARPPGYPRGPSRVSPDDEKTQQRLADLEKRLESVLNTSSAVTFTDTLASANRLPGSRSSLDVPVNRLPSNRVPDGFGFDLPTGDLDGALDFFETNFSVRGKDGQPSLSLDGYLAILPLDSEYALSNTGAGFGTGLGDADSLVQGFEDTRGSFVERDLGSRGVRTEPRYTIPMNATLYEATAMTALIGRVPVNGAVQDAFPLKILLGADNLAANGHRIPGLSGMIFSGIATGDWNLSCVSAQIHSATFIWDDGRIQTLTENTLQDQDLDRGTYADEQSNAGGSIGWVSSRSGIPCVPGKRITDAGSVSAAQIGLALGEGYAQALAQSQVSNTVTDSGNTLSAVTGNRGDYYNNIAVSNALGEIRSIVEERWRDTFDAIFIEPGRTVSIHITRTLPVDYDPTARKLVHTGTGSDTWVQLD